MKSYRDNGAIGALLDEYEKAVIELQSLIKNISETKLVTIADSTTKDPDCISIQTILTHVVRSGYNYVVEIRKHQGEALQKKVVPLMQSSSEYEQALKDMFEYNVQLFEDYPAIQLEEKDPSKKITVSWKQQFDVEQLLEHAIVHILRHRRQIERFLIKLD